MAKFNPAADLDKYDKGGKYFSLKNDGDSADVRILWNTEDDIDGYNVHRVKVNGFDVDVNCLRTYNDALDVCPLCEAKYRTTVKFYVPIYNNATGDVSIWTKGKNFYSQLVELCRRCNPLVSYPLTIERKGAAGDINTTYEIYDDPSDGTLIEDLDVEVPDPIKSGALLDKTFEELTTYVQTGSFDGETVNGSVNNGNNAEATIERRRRDIGGNTATRRRSVNGDIPL